MNIAVLMSSYNGERYIRQQIDSILAQKGDFTLELWVRDDGSTDGTQKILAEYAAEGKLRWYAGENLRSAHSFLNLVQHCPGYDYYAFADQDDYWMPEKLNSGLNMLRELHGPALYFANAELVDTQLDSLGRKVYRAAPALDYYTLSCAGGLLGCTMIFNKKLAELVQQAPLPGPIVMHDFYLAVVCALFDGTIVYDNEAYMKYRQHGANVVGVSRNKPAALKNRLRIITNKSPVTVSRQAASMLDCYTMLPRNEKREWLETLAHAERFGAERFKVALSSKTRYASVEKSLTLRLAILLGNR